VRAQTVTFDDTGTGKPPPGWTVAITGKGEPKWTVERDDTAPSKTSRAQTIRRSAWPSFPLCIKDVPALKDGFVEVKFKSVSGKGDQSRRRHLALRRQGQLLHLPPHALEDNVVLYKVEQGKRTALDIVGLQGRLRRRGEGGPANLAYPACWSSLGRNSPRSSTASNSLRWRTRPSGRRQSRPVDQRRQRDIVR